MVASRGQGAPISAIMGYFKMKNVSVNVSVSIADWMRSHGHAVRPALTKQERAQLAECFALMDGDGSGAIDVDELYKAFRVLGLHVTKKSVSDLLAQVDSDGSGARHVTVAWRGHTSRNHAHIPLSYCCR